MLPSPVLRRTRRRGKTNLGLLAPLLDNLLQSRKGSAHDKEDAPRIDRLPTGLAPALQFHHGLHLARQVHRVAQRHFRFLHQLEQRGLHPAPADIPPDHVAGRRDFVDLVDVNNAVLRALGVAIGLLHQFTHQVLDITTHVACLAEFCRVGLDERDTDQFRDVSHEIGFAHAGRAGDDHVLFGIFDRCGLAAPGALAQKFRVVVMVAYRDGEHLFRFVLLYDIAVEVRFDLTRREMKIEDVIRVTRHRLGSARRLGGRRGRLLEGGLQKGLQAPLQFVGPGKIGFAHPAILAAARPDANPANLPRGASRRPAGKCSNPPPLGPDQSREIAPKDGQPPPYLRATSRSHRPRKRRAIRLR